MVEKHPVASLARLRELGMDPKIYPACGEFIQRSVPNVGKVTEQKGCIYWNVCEWRDGTKHMKQRGPGDTHPRPRYIKTRFVKPNPTGPGDKVIDNFCGCWQWHHDLKRRHKKNRELAAVIGGEGDKVTLRTSNKVLQPDGTAVFNAAYKTVEIPIFPDPTESPDLVDDVFAGQARRELDIAVDEAEDNRRLGLRSEEENLGDGTAFVEMAEGDAKASIGR